jgi:hypothetical protein
MEPASRSVGFAMRVRSPSPSPAFRPDSTPPPPLESTSWRLAPLHPDLAALDYAAWRSCRERLVAELQWNGWPGPDFSLEENVADLERHYGEFERREAYAYSVLGDGECLGCVYIEPWRDGAQLAFWVVDSALPIEGEVVADVLDWLGRWPIGRVVLPLHPGNLRGQGLLASLGLVRCPGPEGHLTFAAVG